MGYDRRNARVDGNHREIINALESIPGISVKSVATIKKFVDIIVGYKGRNFLFELKDPKKPPSARKLTPGEKEFQEKWTGQSQVALSVEEILQVIGFK